MPRRSLCFSRFAGWAMLLPGLWLLVPGTASAQGKAGSPMVQMTPVQTVSPAHRQRPASELISKQEPPKITPRVLDKATPDTTSILVSISKQRAWLMSNGEIAIDEPVSTGKAAGMTPTGKFTVLEKDQDHRSTVYGNFVNHSGQVVRGGVSTRIDSAPSGTHYVGAPMFYFLRLHDAVGMHIGILPGYPASHGCVRQPAEIAPLIYEKVKVGTPVEIVN